MFTTNRDRRALAGQKSYGPFCLSLFSGLSVFTTRILNLPLMWKQLHKGLLPVSMTYLLLQLVFRFLFFILQL